MALGAPKTVVLHPGIVPSKRDGQRHYIGADQLMDLYELRPADHVIVASHTETLMSHSELADDPNVIHLWPRYNGDYGRPRSLDAD